MKLTAEAWNCKQYTVYEYLGSNPDPDTHGNTWGQVSQTLFKMIVRIQWDSNSEVTAIMCVWTEKPGELQSMESQDLATKQQLYMCVYIYIHIYIFQMLYILIVINPNC